MEYDDLPLFCEICGDMPARVAPQGNRCRQCYELDKRLLHPCAMPMQTVADFLGVKLAKSPKPPLTNLVSRESHRQ